MACNPDCSLLNSVKYRLPTVMARLRSLRRNEEGTISVLSVIALLLLTMLLGMILNVGEQLDEKIELQNAADAASYSSSVVVARGMNTVAFTNHLLSETFALTAYFREGRDRSAESLVPEILNTWEKLDGQLELSSFKLIRDIKIGLLPKIQMEREMVQTFGDMTQMKARLILPALETILGLPENPNSEGLTADQQKMIALTHLIPTFQRTVMLAIPAAATEVVNEIGRRNARGLDGRVAQTVVWTTWLTAPVQTIDQRNPRLRMLPGLDPSYEGPDSGYLDWWEIALYQSEARRRRDGLAEIYLREWEYDRGFDLAPFYREHHSEGGMVYAKMSNFFHMWRGFTGARLQRLLNEEYPTTNLPHMIRLPNGETQQQYLEHQFSFDTTIYRRQRTPRMPGMYRVPIRGDNVAFARATVYLPLPRIVTEAGCPAFHCWGWDRRVRHHRVWQCQPYECIEKIPTEWSLFSQNWAARLIPTSPEAALGLLQTNPQSVVQGVTLPNMSSLQVQDLKAINFH